MYADDTSLTAAGSDLAILLNTVNDELNNIHEWLCANKLTLNTGKTKYLIFQPIQKQTYNLYLPLKLSDEYLNHSYSVKYLGLILDSHLSWQNHIDYISKKISKSLNIMTKVKKYLGKKALISIYYSLVYPYLMYGCILWGNNYNASLSPIIRLQNRAIRIINDVDYFEHITPHYVDLGFLKFPDIVKSQTCLFFFDHMHDAKPSSFGLTLISEQHNYSTRSASSQLLSIPRYRTNLRKFCPSVIGCYFWDDLPISAQKQTSKSQFKKSLHQYYFSQY